MICNEADGTDAAGLKFGKIIDGMKHYTSEQIESAKKGRPFGGLRRPPSIEAVDHGN